MNSNLKIAAAVAFAIGGGAASHTASAAGPAVSACAAGAKLYIAGSSAGQPAFATALATDLFGGSANMTTISAPAVTGSFNGNFKAYCGAAVSGNSAGIPSGNIITAFYRGEGGSVIGVLPIVNNKPVKFLDISVASCQVTNPSMTGLSKNVGTTDGWTGCQAPHAVELGISDLEPTVFVSPNNASLYSTTVFGSVTSTAAQIAAAIPAANVFTMFQQVFGLYVNTSGFNGGGVGQAVDLSRETASAILTGAYTDWSQVPTASGGLVSTTSVPIVLVNREGGSGSRAGATVYFAGTNCNKGAVIPSFPATTTSDGFATGDVLTTADATAGAITYASIDNSKTNLSIATLAGVVPSNLAATSGAYDYWFEATAQKGASVAGDALSLRNWLTTGNEMSNIATAPHVKSVLAIPTDGTNGTIQDGVHADNVLGTASVVGGVTIYLNPFTKGGNSCNIATSTN